MVFLAKRIYGLFIRVPARTHQLAIEKEISRFAKKRHVRESYNSTEIVEVLLDLRIFSCRIAPIQSFSRTLLCFHLRPLLAM